MHVTVLNMKRKILQGPVFSLKPIPAAMFIIVFINVTRNQI